MPTTADKLRASLKRVPRLKEKVASLQHQISAMKDETAKVPEKLILEKIKTLPLKQQLSVIHCFKAAKLKSTRGMAIDSQWILECIMMRIKSPQLYKHIRAQNILVLPSKSCLQKYVKAYNSGFGFNKMTFAGLSLKTKRMDVFQRHGGLVIDELKLSEHLNVQSSGLIQGFVDLGTFTPKNQRNELCDHGLIVLFQPFVGSWTQIVGTFASRGNVKADLLAKIVIEAVILCEQAGLHVDFITSDGAAWNRQMWKSFGICSTTDGVKFKVEHPVSSERCLHFISDFPHLIKCVRNMLVKTGFQTPEGRVLIEHVEAAWKADSSNISLKAMPRITKSHLRPNNFEKMKVNLAFHLFSQEVLRGLYMYKDVIEMQYGSSVATEAFIRVTQELVEVMTSREPRKALRPGSMQVQFLKSFLAYLQEWIEFTTENGGGFLSESTAFGLQVTISSTVSLLEYVTTKLGFKYLMTSTLSQDRLENIFGIVRQSSGCNVHPTPSQFLISVNCLSFYNLARPPQTGNSSAETVSALLDLPPQQTSVAQQQKVDAALDIGNLEEARHILNSLGQPLEHEDMAVERSDSRLIFYVAGYAARKGISALNCESCADLLVSKHARDDRVDSYTRHLDRGGLLYVSDQMCRLVETMENAFTACMSKCELHSDAVMEVSSVLQGSLLNRVGCESHQTELTNRIIKFYILTRLHFYVKSLNRGREKRKRIKNSKLGRL
ncbi:uncharacterized protein LOC135388758 [Ornithodoros turicata]|uniref:uncharacterized protein LOC135388758 n=1 Tax=Ornithodoros turicata TaxID=34597 RepID=UPI003139F04C